MAPARRVAVVGGGWAGLAAAVEATRRGHRVTVFEMAGHLGGRAREVDFGHSRLDNGQHILIGAYTESLSLMRFVGVDLQRAFVRTPLRIRYPEGAGLQLGRGAPMLAFTKAVLSYRGWRLSDKLALLSSATRWTVSGFRCDASLTVAELTAHLPQRVRNELLDPLCVAALNTPSMQASAAVFLRVLRDALFSGSGSADLLLPRQRLSELWPRPAERWLRASGASVRTGHRVQRLAMAAGGWQLDGETFDAVVLACTAAEASRLTADVAPGWSRQAGALHYEPIVTVYARRTAGPVFPEPMLALHSDGERPVQFAFDLSALGGPDGVLALVISGAKDWVARGMEAVEAASLAQLRSDLGPGTTVEALQTATEKRATFLCTPGLARPAPWVQPGLLAAGDYVAGPYPATLEGAVRSGLAAARDFRDAKWG
jgi:hydroxysqualene dehydroxylase